MTGDDWITLGKKYRKQNGVGTEREIYNLLLQLDAIFDDMDCALDCPCHAYCDGNVSRSLCTVVTLAVEALKK